MLPAKVLLDPCEVTKSPRWVVVDTAGLWAHIGPLPVLFAVPLLQLPWKVMASPVELKVLVPLKSLLAYLTHKPVGGHKGLWR